MNQQNLCLPWPRNLSACLRGLHQSWSLLGSLSSFTYYLEVIFGTLRAAFHCLPASCRPAKQLEFATLFFSFFVQFFFSVVFSVFQILLCFFFCSPSVIAIWDAHMFDINHFYLARSCSLSLASSSSSSLFWKFLMTNCCPSIYHYYSYIYLAFARQIVRHANDLDITI